MKFILLAILIASCCSRCACNAQLAVNNVKPTLVNGPILHGSATRTTQVIEKQLSKVLITDIVVGSSKISGTFHAPLQKETNSQWCLTKDYVVRLGHEKAKQTVLLIPNILYGVTDACWVSGYLFHDLVDDSYVTRQITFSYKDPVDGENIVEAMTGGLVVVKTENNKVTYDVSFTWRNTKIESMDSIFAGVLKGTISRSVINGDGFVENGMKLKAGDQVIDYNFQAENLTNTQLNNFINWWTHCMLPSF